MVEVTIAAMDCSLDFFIKDHSEYSVFSQDTPR